MENSALKKSFCFWSPFLFAFFCNFLMKGVKNEQICDQEGSSVKGLTSRKCTGSFGFWYSQYLFKSVPIEIRDGHSDLVHLETFGDIRSYAVHSDKISPSK